MATLPAQQCLAPGGPPDQGTYESLLIRGAWFDIAFLGLPENGASPDEEAIAATIARFPDLLPGYMVIALKYVHMLADCCPFR